MRSALVSFLILGAAANAAMAQVAIGPWSGAVTPTSATVNVKMSGINTNARLLVSTSADLSNPMYFDPAPSHATLNIASFAVSGLNPSTQYHYAVQQGTTTYTAQQGKFSTFASGPTSFSFAFGACASTGSNHRVFEHIQAQSPLFYANIGDFHYQDINVNNATTFRNAYDAVLSAQRQSSLYRNVPLVYMWDDHDYGPNDSDKNAPGRTASRQVYQEYTPHYPLASGGGNAPIDQAFSVGQARFIMSDLRSERDPKSATDNANKKMMNDTQFDWFKQEVLAAKSSGQMIFWVSSVPWIQNATAGSDMWGGYATQRKQIANFLAENAIDNLVILSGDAHMLAADNGTNANFSDYPDAPLIRVLQAAALDRTGSVKGGPYSAGTYPSQTGFGQYGLVTVTDLGNEMQILFSGRAVNGTDGTMTERVSLQFNVAIPEPTVLGLLGTSGLLLLRRR